MKKSHSSRRSMARPTLGVLVVMFGIGLAIGACNEDGSPLEAYDNCTSSLSPGACEEVGGTYQAGVCLCPTS